MAEKIPIGVVVTVPKVETPKVIVTAELGANPAPAISTEVPTGPEVVLRKMIGFNKAVTVNVFEAELEPCVALTV